jgi:hypothetical protein
VDRRFRAPIWIIADGGGLCCGGGLGLVLVIVLILVLLGKL